MDIYKPGEDSYFLTDVLKKNIIDNLDKNDIKVLDVGSGSGILTNAFINTGVNPKNITLLAINPKAINHLKINFPESKVIKSNLFSNIKVKFDLIIFNPPYLPEDKFDKEKDTTGGKTGDETILKFLKNIKNYLAPEGKAILLLSSLTPMKRINQEFKNYRTILLARKKIFFEELFVYELSPSR